MVFCCKEMANYHSAECAGVDRFQLFRVKRKMKIDLAGSRIEADQTAPREPESPAPLAEGHDHTRDPLSPLGPYADRIRDFLFRE